MPNVFELIDTLKNKKNSRKFSLAEQTYLHELLNAFEKIAVLPKKPDIDKLIQSINAEKHKAPITHVSYQLLLKKCLTICEKMSWHTEIFKYFQNNNPHQFKKAIQKRDSLYEKTETEFKGTIMLPVNQGVDPRLGTSGGECLGYFLQWTTSMLKNKNPFGISSELAPPFKPIPLDSAMGKQYFYWNHLAVLTNNINNYQNIKNSVDLEREPLSICHFYLKISNIATDLLKKVEEKPNSVYLLKLFGTSLGFRGHAVGFCKKNNKYHFFDSNYMWVRFDGPEDFQKWFTFYFTISNYNKLFSEYNIDSCELKNNNPPLPILNGFIEKALAYSILTILSPLLITGIALGLTYFCIGRPLIYLGIRSKQYGESAIQFLINKLKSRETSSNDQDEKYSPDKKIKLEYAKDDMLELKKINTTHEIDSTYTIANSLIDASPIQILNAHKNLLANGGRPLDLPSIKYDFLNKKTKGPLDTKSYPHFQPALLHTRPLTRRKKRADLSHKWRG